MFDFINNLQIIQFSLYLKSSCGLLKFVRDMPTKSALSRPKMINSFVFDRLAYYMTSGLE